MVDEFVVYVLYLHIGQYRPDHHRPDHVLFCRDILCIVYMMGNLVDKVVVVIGGGGYLIEGVMCMQKWALLFKVLSTDLRSMNM